MASAILKAWLHLAAIAMILFAQGASAWCEIGPGSEFRLWDHEKNKGIALTDNYFVDGWFRNSSL